MKSYSAAIFDMDGLLLDTERVCKRIFKAACETHNEPFYEDIYHSIIGRNSAGIDKILRDAYGAKLDVIHAEWRKNYNDVVLHQANPIKEGVIELLKFLQANDVKLAVATSTEKSVAKTKLQLAKLDQYFDVVTTGCEVTHGKPAPDIYLLAARRLALPAEQCLAFEDSNNGVRAAVAANMITYQIPDLVQPDTETLTLGHQVRPSLLSVLEDLQAV